VTEPFYAPRFEIRISGVTMAADVADQVLSLTVETDLDMAGSFSLVLRNPDNKLLDSPLIDLGKTVEIHLGYGVALEPAFLGEIAAIEPSFPQDGPATIRVSGYDKSYKMRRSQPDPTDYGFLADSVIAARIAEENGLIPVVDPTPGLPDEPVKQVGSDMAFLKSRARPYFFDVYVEWDRLHFQFPRPQTAAFVLEWGRNLSSFSPRISAAGLAGLQVIRGYNQELAQSVTAAAVAADVDPGNLLERLGSSAVDLLASLVRSGVRKDSIQNPLDAVKLAKALLSDLLEGLYEGQGRCVGIPGLTAGNYIEIRGVGKRFSGTYRVRKVTHRIDGNGYGTDFSITAQSHSSLLGMLRKQIAEEPSPTRAERFYGVVLAEVVKNHELVDTPPKVPLGRVMVSYPGLSDDFTSGWAPCVRPMAGDDMGFYALPQEGEQVLVAFEHGDLSKPYVLGSLWNAKQSPPEKNADGKNNLRLIKSKAGHTIVFDDTAQASQLVVKDGKGSSITLNAQDGSITISARKDLTITAKGTLKLQAADGKTVITMDDSKVDVT
jgi:phage protein D/phage baseplate assembly protein gpV